MSPAAKIAAVSLRRRCDDKVSGRHRDSFSAENSSGENGLEADANDGTPSVQRANIWAGTGAVDMFA